jgi:hypothetical protein
MISDTPAEIVNLQAAMYGALPFDQKLAIMDAMYRSGRELADVGLRQRKPNATPRECLENWVRLTLPTELVPHALEVAVQSADSALSEVRYLARKLAPLGMELVVGGSVAAAVYANPRHTQDADVSVQPFPGREAEVLRALESEYYVSLPAMKSANEKRRTFNVLRNATTFKIDIFVQGGRPFDQSAFSRKQLLPPATAGDVAVYVHSPEDVVLQKLAWYRLGNEASENQWKDVLGILRSQRGKLDEPYVQKWAEELNVADLWRRAQEQLAPPSAENSEPQS